MIRISNPAVRNILYFVVVGVIGLTLGSINVFCAASDRYVLPPWMPGAMAVYTFVAGQLGFLASANTPSGSSEISTPVSEEPEIGTVPARLADA